MLLELESDHQVRQSISQRQMRTLPGQIEQYRLELVQMQQDLVAATAIQAAPFALQWFTGREDNVVPISDRKAAAKKIWTWILMAREAGKATTEPLGRYGSFELRGRQSWKTLLVLDGPSGLSYAIETKDSAAGNMKALEGLADEVQERIYRTEYQIRQSEAELAASTQAVQMPFEQAEQLKDLLGKQAALAEELGLLDVEVA